MPDPICYVLLSGGVDSTTALSLAMTQFKEVRAVSIDYGQRHRREISHAEAIAQKLRVAYEVLRVAVPRTMLTDSSIEVPKVAYSEIEGVSPTYVPFRNGLILATLTSRVAGRHLDPTQAGSPDYDRSVCIYIGVHAEDAERDAYPDCRVDFISAMGEAIKIGTYDRVRLFAPFVMDEKAEIIHRGHALGTPYEMTWSCYVGGQVHCGECATCRARRAAFVKAGVPDPTIYAE